MKIKARVRIESLWVCIYYFTFRKKYKLLESYEQNIKKLEALFTSLYKYQKSYSKWDIKFSNIIFIYKFTKTKS